MVHLACGLAQTGLMTVPMPNVSINRTEYPLSVDQQKVQL